MQILTYYLATDDRCFKRSGRLLKNILKQSPDLPSPCLSHCYESIARMLGFQHRHEFKQTIKTYNSMIFDFPDEGCSTDQAETRIVHQARRLAKHQSIRLDRALEITEAIQPSAITKMAHDDDSIRSKLKYRFPELHYSHTSRVSVLIDLKHDMSEEDVDSNVTWLQFDRKELSQTIRYLITSDPDDVFLYGANDALISRAESLFGKGSVHLLI